MANQPVYASAYYKKEIVRILNDASTLKTLNYRVNNIVMTPNRLVRVANAIERNRIPIRTDTPRELTTDFGYFPDINTLFIPMKFLKIIGDINVRAAIVHEGIHMANDVYSHTKGIDGFGRTYVY